MSSIYLASRYARAAEMQAVRDALLALGHTVTSRWIDLCGKQFSEAEMRNALDDDSAGIAYLAERDREDLFAADVVISFTGGAGWGGRHVEFGMAIALGKRCIVVGPREHAFHALPEVEHYADLRGLAATLAAVVA